MPNIFGCAYLSYSVVQTYHFRLCKPIILSCAYLSYLVVHTYHIQLCIPIIFSCVYLSYSVVHTYHKVILIISDICMSVVPEGKVSVLCFFPVLCTYLSYSVVHTKPWCFLIFYLVFLMNPFRPLKNSTLISIELSQ